MGVVRLPVITGPTAAGKSALAAHLARLGPVTIISADSRQVYRGFDIGTAKPDAAERAAIPHVGIDVASPTERWSAARWVEVAIEGIESARAAGRVPLVVGGTGMYIRALVEPLFEEPPLDPEARAALARDIESWSIDALRRRVEQLDPSRAHLGRTQLLRAIEVATLTGVPLSQWHVTHAKPPRYSADYLVVDPGASLTDRIAHRVDGMLSAGWLDEVRTLTTEVPGDAPAWNATGYAQVRDVVQARRGLVDARAEVIIRTRQYAKRQRTWIRHQLPATSVTTIDPAAETAVDELEAWWHARGREA